MTRVFVYFMAFRYILCPFGTCIFWPFGLFYGALVNFTRFGTSCQVKSGNPDQDRGVSG
jgi:hypothetical protein